MNYWCYRPNIFYLTVLIGFEFYIKSYFELFVLDRSVLTSMAHHMLSFIWSMPIGHLNVNVEENFTIQNRGSAFQLENLYSFFMSSRYYAHLCFSLFFKRRIYALVDSWYIYIYRLNKYVQHYTYLQKIYNIVHIFLIYNIKSMNFPLSHVSVK